MMPPPLRQLLVDKGRPGALAFVATQSDVLVSLERKLRNYPSACYLDLLHLHT